MKKFFQLTILSILVIGCQNKERDSYSTRFHDDGRGKAIVTVTPMFDQHNIHLPWSLSESLTEKIRISLMNKSNVYVTKEALHNEDSLVSEQEHPHVPLEENQAFDVNVHALKQKYPKSEFVVFMELAEHKIVPRAEAGGFADTLSPSHELHAAVRLRVYDLRQAEPEIVLQEMVEQIHLIPKSFTKLDYDSTLWGKKTYSITPLGIAHHQLAKNISSRIEHYLILAKTK